MADNNNNYCIILAGGKGRRLWPVSREEYPKQFLDFFGDGRTQLQQTYDRMLQIVPETNIFISTHVNYLELVRKQLPMVAEHNILAEPIHRNTAPCVAWATDRIVRTNPDANIIVTPSDQEIRGMEQFVKNAKDGLDFVATHDSLLTVGVKPTRPEPGYGYIQMGNEAQQNVYKVQSFTEKPDRDFARMFLDSGEFLWNTGIFLSNARYLRECFEQFLPVVLRNMKHDESLKSYEDEQTYVEQNYPRYPNLSIDYGILEKSDNVYVMHCDFGWADLGTWHSIYETRQEQSDDNVIVDSDVYLENATHNIIRLPKGKKAVINGLEGYIVAEDEHTLLICPKEDSSALIRKYSLMS